MKKGVGEYQIKKAKTSKAEILNVLQDGRWHRYNEIKEATGLSSATLSKHLEELLKGIIEKKLDLESGEYPYPVLYRIKPFVFERAKPLEPKFTKNYKLIRYDLHFLNELLGLITLDFLELYLENPEEKEEIFNQAIENFIINRFRESLELIKQELLKQRNEGKNIIEFLKENKKLYKSDYDFLLKNIVKKDRKLLSKENPSNP